MSPVEGGVDVSLVLLVATEEAVSVMVEVGGNGWCGAVRCGGGGGVAACGRPRGRWLVRPPSAIRRGRWRMMMMGHMGHGPWAMGDVMREMDYLLILIRVENMGTTSNSEVTGAALSIIYM